MCVLTQSEIDLSALDSARTRRTRERETERGFRGLGLEPPSSAAAGALFPFSQFWSVLGSFSGFMWKLKGELLSRERSALRPSNASRSSLSLQGECHVFGRRVAPAKKQGGGRGRRRGGHEISCTKEKGLDSSGDKMQSRWINVPRVSYHGVPGAFSSLAAKQILPNCEPVACDTLDLVTSSVVQWSSDIAIVPVQNTLEGTLHEIQDSLVSCGLHIVGEVNIPIIHCLMALPSVKKQDIKTVLSHPGALAQCSTFLKDFNAVREAVFDTAFGAKMIKTDGLANTAAIASEEAATQYGLQVLEKDIHDKERGENIQRYLILARDPAEYDESFTYKTSLVFTLDEGSGQLFKALSVFALRDMNITKIESRPLRANPILATEEGSKQFNYIFYLDFLGHTSEVKVKQAMRHRKFTYSQKKYRHFPFVTPALRVLNTNLFIFIFFFELARALVCAYVLIIVQELTPFFKVLGSYPIDNKVWDL